MENNIGPLALTSDATIRSICQGPKKTPDDALNQRGSYVRCSIDTRKGVAPQPLMLRLEVFALSYGPESWSCLGHIQNGLGFSFLLT